MQWIEATLRCASTEIDILCTKLADLGIEGLSIEDENDFRQFLENNHKYWDYVDDDLNEHFSGLSQIKFYLEENAEGQAKLEEIRTALQREISTSLMADEDWANSWKDAYEPLPIGERLLVVPDWMDPELDGRLALRLEPGLAFGTGSHATTRMCLAELENYAKPGVKLLDLGCGSGILGIGGLVLGADFCLGCDIDPKAPDVVMSNAALNGIGKDRMKVYAGDIISDASLRRDFGSDYDVVLANIVSDVIIPLSRYVKGFMKEDGVFITSGIIEGRQDEVRAAIEAQGFRIIRHHCEEEWHCFAAVIA